jgi:hypothetical protein
MANDLTDFIVIHHPIDPTNPGPDSFFELPTPQFILTKMVTLAQLKGNSLVLTNKRRRSFLRKIRLAIKLGALIRYPTG